MRLDGSPISSVPQNRTEPVRWPRMPMIARRVVVLPAPLRPSRVATSPSSTAKSMPCRTCDSPYQACNPSTSSSGGASLETRQPDRVEQFIGPVIQPIQHPLRAPEMKRIAESPLQRDPHVLADAQMREHGRDLERAHKAAAGDIGRPRGGDVIVAVENPPGARLEEFGQQVEDGGLAGAV